MISALGKPYPFNGQLWPNLRFHIAIGIFVAFFLIVFEPFGTANWVIEYKIAKLAGYGIISFLMPTIVFFFRSIIISKLHFEHKYKVKHEIMWLTAVLVSIALANCLYVAYLHASPLTLRMFGYGIFMVCAIGVFPVLASIYLKYNQYLTLNEKEAKVLDDLVIEKADKGFASNDEVGQKITFIAENGKDKITIEADALLYIESLENYTNIVFSKEGKTSSIMLRSSLKRLEDQINSHTIVRCHRSFIVNLKNVLHFSGNAQGYLMSIAGTETKIPVSRSYGPKILEELKPNKNN